uniref:Uncharacterized protein n=1 Tax=Anguilla anguilla TaxID=7936 RepID=A0A0E9W678_ANGAN
MHYNCDEGFQRCEFPYVLLLVMPIDWDQAARPKKIMASID